MEVKKETLFITVDEAASYMGVGRDVVKRMIKVPDFPLIYIGTQTKLLKPKILEWLDKHKGENFGN